MNELPDGEKNLTELKNKIVKKNDWLPHEMAEMTLFLEGKPLNLTNYKLMHPLYDKVAPNNVYKTGRQVTKTTTLAGVMTITCFLLDFYKSLYVAPLEKQSNKFSNLNIRPLLKHSPIIKTKIDSDSSKSVLLKTFTNGSLMHFSYCQNGADRIRTISVDEVNWDEVQDILYDVMPVIFECTSHSEYRIQRFCGTPKTLENTIEYLWGKSSQNEPIVKCSRCGKYNVPDLNHAYSMIGEKGPICFFCKRLLRFKDIINPEWVAADPDREDFFLGHHIPQIFVPRNLTPRAWKFIWENYKSYSKGRFCNEVLGLSYDTGGRLVTLSELKKLCVLEPVQNVDKRKYINICAGVDWGISAVTSFTVIIVVGLRPDLKWDVLFFHKFLETDTIYQVDMIAKILKYWECDLVGCDHGVGNANNQQLRRRWCSSNLHKLSEYNYVGGNHLIRWNKNTSRFSLHKVQSLNNLFFEIKEGKVLFPKTKKVREVFDDILAEYEQISEGPFTTKKIFLHPPEVPDDYLQALNYAIITSKRLAKMLIVDYSFVDNI